MMSLRAFLQRQVLQFNTLVKYYFSILLNGLLVDVCFSQLLRSNSKLEKNCAKYLEVYFMHYSTFIITESSIF